MSKTRFPVGKMRKSRAGVRPLVLEYGDDPDVHRPEQELRQYRSLIKRSGESFWWYRPQTCLMFVKDHQLGWLVLAYLIMDGAGPDSHLRVDTVINRSLDDSSVHSYISFAPIYGSYLS